MFKICDVESYLDDNKVKFVSDIQLRETDKAIMLYIPRSKIASKMKIGFTSLRQLSFIKNKLAEKYSVKVEIILFQEDKHQELESGFHQILNRAFDDKVISFYMSFVDESVIDAFIEVSCLDEKMQEEITEHFSRILKEASLHSRALYWLNSATELPSLITLLRMLKATQPSTVKNLTLEMQKDYEHLSIKWVGNKLDQLRKKDLVVRQSDAGTYVLTDKAIKIIPAGARRSSSDVDRALALGRRTW